MDETFYNDYFKGLAERADPISHNDGTHKAFFVIDSVDDMKEVQEAIRKTMCSPALLLETFEDDLTDRGSDNNTEVYHGAIAVIIRVSSKDIVAIRQAKQQARAIAKQIMFKARLDSMYGTLMENGITAKLESPGFAVGPVADNCYGWRYGFTWTAPVIIAPPVGFWNT